MSSKIHFTFDICPALFRKRKEETLRGKDKSMKGSIDEEIRELIEILNNHDDIVTTSSCSGRLVIFSKEEPSGTKGKCKFVFSSHDPVKEDDAITAVFSSNEDNLTLKYEPFILHARCRTVQLAKDIHVCAVHSGFRNSGITLGRGGNVMIAIRSTLNLEAPLKDNGINLVSDEYIRHLIQLTNGKMSENSERIQKLLANIKPLIEKTDVDPSKDDEGPSNDAKNRFEDTFLEDDAVETGRRSEAAVADLTKTVRSLIQAMTVDGKLEDTASRKDWKPQNIKGKMENFPLDDDTNAKDLL